MKLTIPVRCLTDNSLTTKRTNLFEHNATTNTNLISASTTTVNISPCENDTIDEPVVQSDECHQLTESTLSCKEGGVQAWQNIRMKLKVAKYKLFLPKTSACTVAFAPLY